MRIQFILDSALNESLGMFTLSALLKQRGHTVGLTIASYYRTISGFVDAVIASKPDIIACSVMTAQADWYESICLAIKARLNVPVAWGGAHPTFMPEFCPDCVDYIFRGESDLSFIEFIESNWSMQPRMRIGDLVENLDSLPFPDRDLLYSQSYMLRNFALKRVLSTRGCPFNCSYCFEPALHKLYSKEHSSSSPFVRRHSPDYVIAEIQDILARFPGGRHIHFSDDSFNLSRPWMNELLPKYAEKINLSYSVNLAVPLVDRGTIDLLAETGCRGIIVGLETGNETIRKNILTKPIKDEQYYALADLLEGTNIRLITNVMYALPTDTIDDWMSAISMARRMKVKEVRPCILKAYKGTAIAVKVKDLPHSEEKFTISEKRTDNPDVMLYLTWLFLTFPLPIEWCKRIVQSKYARFMRIFILLSYWDYIKLYRLRLWQAAMMFYSNKKLLWVGIASRGKG